MTKQIPAIPGGTATAGEVTTTAAVLPEKSNCCSKRRTGQNKNPAGLAGLDDVYDAPRPFKHFIGREFCIYKVQYVAHVLRGGVFGVGFGEPGVNVAASTVTQEPPAQQIG